MEKESLAHVWTFAKKSERLLELCLQAAGQPDESNKWISKFKYKNNIYNKETDNAVIIEDSPDIDASLKREINVEDDVFMDIEEMTDLEFDVIEKFEYLQEKCLKNPILLTKLAENLTNSIKETFIEHIFENTITNVQLLEKYFEYFLPIHIKSDNSRSCIYLFEKTHQIYPSYFIILLKMVIKNTEIQNNILNDYVLSLNVDQQTEFLIEISKIDITGEQFIHNLLCINTAYKTCNKTEKIQNCIFSLLKKFSYACTIDKNYGKLLLAFLQNQMRLKCNIDILLLKEIIDSHNSAFKRPCIAIFKELKSV